MDVTILLHILLQSLCNLDRNVQAQIMNRFTIKNFLRLIKFISFKEFKVIIEQITLKFGKFHRQKFSYNAIKYPVDLTIVKQSIWGVNLFHYLRRNYNEVLIMIIFIQKELFIAILYSFCAVLV